MEDGPVTGQNMVSVWTGCERAFFPRENPPCWRTSLIVLLITMGSGTMVVVDKIVAWGVIVLG